MDQERPMSWRKPAPDGGLTAKQCERALWVIALALLAVIATSQFMWGQEKPNGKPPVAVAPDKAEVKLPDSIPFDELTQLKMAGLFKDLTIADQGMKLAQQAYKDADKAAKDAQVALQKEYDVFVAKQKIKKEDWLFDPNKWGWILMRKPVEEAAKTDPPKKEKP